MYIWFTRTREAAFLYLAPGISGICASRDFFRTGEQENFFFGLALFFSLFASLKLGDKGQKFLAFATLYRASWPYNSFCGGAEAGSTRTIFLIFLRMAAGRRKGVLGILF